MAKPVSELELEVYERQLDRIHSFFPRIDTKVSALFAISSGQVAIATLNLTPNDLKHWWIAITFVVFLIAVIVVFVNLYRCSYPHLKGGNSSLIYFNEIAKLREAEYIEKFGTLTVNNLKSDLSGQIWRNSEIVSLKYGYLKLATVAAILSVIPWTIFLTATSVFHARIPMFG
jgi:hypothetical protein